MDQRDFAGALAQALPGMTVSGGASGLSPSALAEPHQYVTIFVEDRDPKSPTYRARFKVEVCRVADGYPGTKER